MPTSESESEVSNISEPLPRSRERTKDKRKYKRSGSKPDSPQKKKPASQIESNITLEDTMSSKRNILSPSTPVSFLTTNKFSVLSVDEGPSEEKAIKDNPPPIYLKNITKISEFCRALSLKLQQNKYSIKSRSNDIVLKTETSDGYRKAVTYLREISADFHTYQMKEDKPFRVVLRYLHPSTPVEEIKQELVQLNFIPRTITNVKDRSTKVPLALFFVDLEPNTKNKDIFNLRNLGPFQIKVEEPYKKLDIPQCQRCQAFGHTKQYCNHAPRCVKCAGPHLWKDCKKARETPAICALCNGDHPASFRGCETYKTLQRKMRTAGNNPQRLYQPRQPERAPQLSFQGVFFPDLPQVQPREGPQPLPRHSTRPQPAAQVSYQPVSYASAANHTRPQPYIPPPPASSDITSILSSFLADLKAVVTPLITLLTTVMTNLIPPCPK